jgi:hypothetical protein
MNVVNRSVLALGLIWGLSAGAAPATKPAASPVAPAIAALLKEYQASLKDKKGEGLREKCDYFLTNKPDDVTPEVILAALEKPVSTDPRADAYVKRQLLSGIPGKFPDTLSARALKVYKAAPMLRPHPGLNHTDLERRLGRIGILKENAEAGINKDFGEAISAYRLGIDPILDYRDELYSRQTASFDVLVAALADVYDRVTHGAPTNDFWATVSASIRAWAISAGDPGRIRQLSAALLKLRDVVKDEKNRPYFKVIYTKSDNYTGLKWAGEGAIANDKTIEDASDFLLEQAKTASAGGGLKFKPGEDTKKK